MAFVGTKTLEYREHRDELACLSRVLNLIQRGDVAAATELLVARQDRLISEQTPILKDYDPRAVVRA